jgi:hypothetical protein
MVRSVPGALRRSAGPGTTRRGLSLEATRGNITDVISTTVRQTVATQPMYFALDASTRVAFLGERHLHAWISHQFSHPPTPPLSLIARARQFFSFLLRVGRIASADTSSHATGSSSRTRMLRVTCNGIPLFRSTPACRPAGPGSITRPRRPGPRSMPFRLPGVVII